MQPKSKYNEFLEANKSSEVFCYPCGGRDYYKCGRNKNGQSYFCQIYRCQFVEKFVEKYFGQSNFLDIHIHRLIKCCMKNCESLAHIESICTNDFILKIDRAL